MTDDAVESLKLPGTLAEIARVAGAPAALALSRDKGGAVVYIPVAPGADHWLVQSVGVDAARAIAAEFGNCRILIPLATNRFYARAARAAAQMIEEGASTAQTARQLGIHVRTVFRHKRRMRGGDDNQGDLF